MNATTAPVQTFYVRHQVPAGSQVATVARAAVEDLYRCARQIGVQPRGEVFTRTLHDAGTPMVEASVRIRQRLHTPELPVFERPGDYARWRRQFAGV